MADIVKTIQTRIAQKHDVEENWNKAENFIPKKERLSFMIKMIIMQQ